MADAGAPAHACAATAVAVSHQVAELALDLGPCGPVVGLPCWVALSFTRTLQSALRADGRGCFGPRSTWCTYRVAGSRSSLRRSWPVRRHPYCVRSSRLGQPDKSPCPSPGPPEKRPCRTCPAAPMRLALSRSLRLRSLRGAPRSQPCRTMRRHRPAPSVSARRCPRSRLGCPGPPRAAPWLQRHRLRSRSSPSLPR